MTAAPSPGPAPPRRRPLAPEAELSRLRRQVRALNVLRDRCYWRPLLSVVGAALFGGLVVFGALAYAGALADHPFVKLGIAAFAGFVASLVARGAWSTLGALVLGLVIVIPLSILSDGAYGGEGLDAFGDADKKKDEEMDPASIRARRLDAAIASREARIRQLEALLGLP